MSIYKDLQFLHGHLCDLGLTGDVDPQAARTVGGDLVAAAPTLESARAERTASIRAERREPGLSVGCCG